LTGVDENNIARNYNSIGMAYQSMGHYDAAMEDLQKDLQKSLEIQVLFGN
jgi:tetratricopeptide (TPR) repeat protein